jgi:hypothetical protein
MKSLRVMVLLIILAAAVAVYIYGPSYYQGRSATQFITKVMEYWVSSGQFPYGNFSTETDAPGFLTMAGNWLFEPTSYSILKTERVAKGRYRFVVEIVGKQKLNIANNIKKASIEIRAQIPSPFTTELQWEILSLNWLDY